MRLRAASEDGRSDERWLPTMTMGTGERWTLRRSQAFGADRMAVLDAGDTMIAYASWRATLTLRQYPFE